MSMGLPTLLALVGTALMAVAIFAPYRLPAPTRIDATVSPLIAPEVSPAWPALVEPAARPCDAAARLDLVDALRAVDSAWSREILATALAQETDPAVRTAIETALYAGASSSQSLVT